MYRGADITCKKAKLTASYSKKLLVFSTKVTMPFLVRAQQIRSRHRDDDATHEEEREVVLVKSAVILARAN